MNNLPQSALYQYYRKTYITEIIQCLEYTQIKCNQNISLSVFFRIQLKSEFDKKVLVQMFNAKNRQLDLSLSTL